MKQKAWLAVLLGASIGGFGGIFIKNFSIPATSITWIRVAVPTILLALWLGYQRVPVFRGHYKKMLLGSALNALRLYLFISAFIFTSIGNAIIMFYTWPIFTTLLGIFILKEQVSLRQIGILALAFIGIIIAYSEQDLSFESQDFIGISAAVTSAFIYALTVIIFKSETLNYHRNEILFYQNFLGAFIFLPLFLTNRPLPTVLDWTLGLSYAVIIGLLAFSLFFFALKHLKASTASMLAYVEVVSAILLSYIWMGDTLKPSMIIGGSLIILSTILLINKKEPT